MAENALLLVSIPFHLEMSASTLFLNPNQHRACFKNSSLRVRIETWWGATCRATNNGKGKTLIKVDTSDLLIESCLPITDCV